MFTGIITGIGTIRHIERRGDIRLVIGCGYDMDTVAIGASIACSGACLTVVARDADSFTVELSAETVARTAPGLWDMGGSLNLERALRVGDELGGHIVTGHVDGVGTVVAVSRDGDSHRIAIEAPPELGPLIAAKGSIAVDGVSLTVNDVQDERGATRFAVNIIPHSWDVTTLGRLAEGDTVNLEIDTLARYLHRMQNTPAYRQRQVVTIVV